YWNKRVRSAAEENVNHHHDQNECDYQSKFHVLNRIDDALRSIEHWNQCDRSGQTRTQFGKERLDRVRNFHRVSSVRSRHGYHNDGDRRIKIPYQTCLCEQLVLYSLSVVSYVT